MGIVPPRIIDIASVGKYSVEEVTQALTLMANARLPFPEYEGEKCEVEVYEELFSLPDLGWFARFWLNFLAGYDLLLHFLGFHCEPPLEPKREQGYYVMPEREAQS